VSSLAHGWDEEAGVLYKTTIEAIKFGTTEDCVKLISVSGCSIIVSAFTPITRIDGSTFWAVNALDEELYVHDENGERFEKCVGIVAVGELEIVRISTYDKSFAAGINKNKRIITHNVGVKP
jgi:hypothetical protein